MFGGFNANKCKIQCQQCKHRIKLLRNKKHVLVEKLCAEVAALQREGKSGMAWIRLEAVIREDSLLQALEVLELYVEMVSQRTALLAKERDIPVDMRGALASIVFASTRVQELPELKQIRAMFQAKYGRQYIAEVSNENTVVENHNAHEQLVRCLIVTPPSDAAKFDRLKAICASCGLEFDEDKVLNDHDLAQPDSRLNSAALGGRGGPGASDGAIMGADYIAEHFGPGRLAPASAARPGQTSHFSANGGIPIPTSPDSVTEDLPFLQSKPLPGPPQQFGHAPPTYGHAPPPAAAPEAACPAASDALEQAAGGARAPTASVPPPSTQAPGSPPAAPADPPAALEAPPAAQPALALGAAPRHFSDEEYAAAVNLGVKQGIEIAMRAALPFCIPQGPGGAPAVLRLQDDFASAAADPPHETYPGFPEHARAAPDGAFVEAALSALPSPPPGVAAADAQNGAGGALYPPGDEGFGFDVQSFYHGFAQASDAPVPPGIGHMSESAFQQAYESAPGVELEAEGALSGGGAETFDPADQLELAAASVAAEPPSSAVYSPSHAPVPPPPDSSELPSDGAANPLTFSTWVGAPGGPSPPARETAAAPAPADPPLPPPPPMQGDAHHGDQAAESLEDLADLPSPPPIGHQPPRGWSGDGGGAGAGGSAAPGDVSALPSPPPNLPNAPRGEVLPSASRTEHYGMSFKRGQAGAGAGGDDVQDDLLLRFNQLKHTDI